MKGRSLCPRDRNSLPKKIEVDVSYREKGV